VHAGTASQEGTRVIVRTHVQMHAPQEQRERTVKQARQAWKERLWHHFTHAFGCPTDARTVWEQALAGTPSWLCATCPLKNSSRVVTRKTGPRPITPSGLWSPSAGGSRSSDGSDPKESRHHRGHHPPRRTPSCAEPGDLDGHRAGRRGARGSCARRSAVSGILRVRQEARARDD